MQAQKLVNVATKFEEIREEYRGLLLKELSNVDSSVHHVSGRKPARPGRVRNEGEAPAKPRRGRPRKNADQAGSETPAAPKGPRGRPRKNKEETPSEGKEETAKRVALPELCLEIAKNVNEPKDIAFFTTEIMNRGYKSTAKDPKNMIYQGLNKLVKEGQLKKNEKREYSHA